MRSGLAQTPLHGGKALAWLHARMVRLPREVMVHVVAEHGPDAVRGRISDPYCFQACGGVLESFRAGEALKRLADFAGRSPGRLASGPHGP